MNKAKAATAASVRTALAVALIATVGCGKKDAARPPADASPLMDPRLPPAEADIAALDAALTVELDALRALSCERPVPRGASPTPDAAVAGEAALAELVRAPAPELKTCIARWTALPKDVRAGLRRCDVDQAASGHCAPVAPQDVRVVAPPGASGAAPVGEIEAVVAACGPVVAARFAAIAAAPGVCSPAAAPRRGPGIDPVQLSHAAHLAEQHAFALARGGRALDGARLMVDVMIAAADYQRGGTAWVDAMIAPATWNRAADDLAALARAPELTADDLDALGAEVDRLLAGLPPVQTTLRGDAAVTILEIARPVVRRAAGGDAGAAAAPAPNQPKTPAEAVFAWRATNAARDLMLTTCSDGTPVVRCMTMLHDQVDGGALGVDTVTAAATMAIPNNVELIRRYARSLAGVHAVRAELAIAARARRAGACPVAEDGAAPELAPVLAAPGLGATLALAPGPVPGQWQLETVGTLGAWRRAEPYVLARFACADGKLIAAPMAAP